ncbi:hypothetical protein TSUD_345190 [Trifolium subterraneum]|nr:hypothetical protein TSUD_345190 [Trifolium subterraneum]
MCVSSMKDMVDFAIYVLGANITVRTTENENGANEKVMLGHVKAVNRGIVTRSLDCHSYLFPYMLYYCHSVPAVSHVVFQMLGSSPGNIEICHWTMYNTLSWMVFAG